jgi:hypothetical protein
MLIVNAEIAPVAFNDVEDETYVLVFHVWITRVRGRDGSIKNALRLRVVACPRQSSHLKERIRQLRDRMVLPDLEIDEWVA